MIKPSVVDPMDEVTTVGKIFGTPLVVKGRTWLPLVQLIAWPIFAWVAGRQHPERSWLKRWGIGALTMTVVLGSEWCHNLAHAAAARLVGKPMDAIRITWGMPLVVYYDINDEDVTPRQHIIRALGGPIFNLSVLPIAQIYRRRAIPGTVTRDVLDAAVNTNAFLPAVGLLPIPGIDGGPILKWSLVESGQTTVEADIMVRKVDGVLGIILAFISVAAFRKRRWVAGCLCVQLAALALSIALGIFKEQE